MINALSRVGKAIKRNEIVRRSLRFWSGIHVRDLGYKRGGEHWR